MLFLLLWYCLLHSKPFDVTQPDQPSRPFLMDKPGLELDSVSIDSAVCVGILVLVTDIPSLLSTRADTART